MQFVILKDDYKVDEYGIEIKRENPPEFKDLKPAMKVINEYPYAADAPCSMNASKR